MHSPVPQLLSGIVYTTQFLCHSVTFRILKTNRTDIYSLGACIVQTHSHSRRRTLHTMHFPIRISFPMRFSIDFAAVFPYALAFLFLISLVRFSVCVCVSAMFVNVHRFHMRSESIGVGLVRSPFVVFVWIVVDVVVVVATSALHLTDIVHNFMLFVCVVWIGLVCGTKQIIFLSLF